MHIVSAREYLFSLEYIGIKLGLDQIRALLTALGRPDFAFPSIVVAGTNGKGSVTAMTECALRAAGYRTGRYTSPHLVDLEERFAIDGAPISPETLERLAARIERAAAALESPPSFFEATTALALEAFRDARVDVAILEVGLGGRLDATNAVDSVGVAITAIDFDHEAYLGNTLEAIAGEKAGVIKPGGLVVVSENPAAAVHVISTVAAAQHARLVLAPSGVSAEARMDDGRLVASITTPHAQYQDLRLGLRGRHQLTNAVTAIRLLEELHAGGSFTIPAAAIRAGLEQVSWPGRLEWRRWREHDILIDGAHNPAGARALAAYIREVFAQPVPIVIGVMRDKHVSEIIAALASVAACFVCTAANSPRAATPDEMADEVRRSAPGVPLELASSPLDAVAMASARGNPVVVAGSLYLAGEVRADMS